ncbi:hypothetical protein [Pseudoalteromonas xiamenensis]
MALEQDIADLIKSADRLTDTVDHKIQSIQAELNAKKAEIDSRLAAKEQAVEGYILNARNEQGFEVQNYNHDFIDLYDRGDIKLPVGMGLHADNPLNDYFDIEIIPVTSGAEPDKRHDVAQELLTAMNIGRGTQHFSGSFNILHLKHKANMPLPTKWVFFIPQQHVKTGQGASFLCWAKGKGFNWQMDTNMQWKQVVYAWRPSPNPGTYVHIDVYMHEVGGELYLALPTIVTGVWPEGRVLGNLYSQKNEMYRKGAAWFDVSLFDAFHDGNTATGGDPANDRV